MLNLTTQDSELMSRRNLALWKSIKDMANPENESQFREACLAMSRAAHSKRKMLENYLEDY